MRPDRSAPHCSKSTRTRTPRNRSSLKLPELEPARSRNWSASGQIWSNGAVLYLNQLVREIGPQVVKYGQMVLCCSHTSKCRGAGSGAVDGKTAFLPREMNHVGALTSETLRAQLGPQCQRAPPPAGLDAVGSPCLAACAPGMLTQMCGCKASR